MDKDLMREKFYIKLGKPQNVNNFNITTEKYLKLVEEVKEAKSGKVKKNRHYWLLKHYDVIIVNGQERLIAPGKDQVLYYVTHEKLFDILYDTHFSIGHGGRDRMRKEFNNRFKNITVQTIQTFLNLCEPCLHKRKHEKRGLVAKPVIFSQLNSRCRVDLIDFQSQPDEDFKFIMVYQDHLTKFVILKALKTKWAAEVAEQILEIFLMFGAPSILQSDDGREFVNSIIDNLKTMWPDLKIIHGKPQPNQLQDTSQDVQNILTTWMVQNNSNRWSKRLKFVQFMKNTTFHSGINTSPYEAMFGQPAKIGLTTSFLPEIIEDINTEEELENLMQEKVNENQETSRTEQVNAEHIEDDELLQQALHMENILLDQQNSADEQINQSNLDKTCKTCEKCFQSSNNKTSLCDACYAQDKTDENRIEARGNLKDQARRMLHVSNVSLPQAEEDDIEIKEEDLNHYKLVEDIDIKEEVETDPLQVDTITYSNETSEINDSRLIETDHITSLKLNSEVYSNDNYTAHLSNEKWDDSVYCEDDPKILTTFPMTVEHDENLHVCNVCQKVFTKTYNLVKHRRIHTAERPYVCDMCDKSFARATTLYIHKRTHTGDKPYVCDVCDKSFAIAGTLQIHKRIHTGVRPYICHVCNISFAHQSNLLDHKRIHMTEKCYVCDICQKAFARASTLQIHKRIHTDNKPYVCDVCDKSFAIAGTLKIHKRIHTGDRPYVCDVCDKSFSAQSFIS